MLKKLFKILVFSVLLTMVTFLAIILFYVFAIYYKADEGNLGIVCEYDAVNKQHVLVEKYVVRDGKKVPLEDDNPSKTCAKLYLDSLKFSDH